MPDEWVLIAAKREWVPEWLYRIFCIKLPFFGQPSLIFPFKQFLHERVNDKESSTTE